VLARRSALPDFSAWNERWQAPFGPSWAGELSLEERLAPDTARTIGPFAFQPNNTTRAVEYPWAFGMADVDGRRVLELGGALSGFQFVLAQTGADVTNVDPFVDYGSEAESPDEPEVLHARMNEIFGTTVRLERSTLFEARLPSDAFDYAFCISTLEHLAKDEIDRVTREVGRVLRPGGRFVLTVDLFLDVTPFAASARNRWGTNVSVRDVVERSGMRLVVGDRRELVGFPEFDPERIRAGLDQYYVGEGYPTLVQMLVLEKEARS
jgi:SAM-dependent methyltransferase